MFKWLKNKILKKELDRLSNIEQKIAELSDITTLQAVGCNEKISALNERFEKSVDVILHTDKQLQNALDESLWLRKQVKMLISETENLRNTITKVLNVGVDINLTPDESWAVICIGGKSEYVAFRELGKRNIMDIASFLKQFKGATMSIDSPCNSMIYSLINE